MWKSRQGTSFLRSGHWFVACEPQQRHHIRRNRPDPLTIGAPEFVWGIPVCLAQRSRGLLPVTVRVKFDLTQKRCPLTAFQHANDIMLPLVNNKTLAALSMTNRPYGSRGTVDNGGALLYPKRTDEAQIDEISARTPRHRVWNGFVCTRAR